jgi:hypothetical protein
MGKLFKIISVNFAFIFLIFCFSGCSDSELSKVSKNLTTYDINCSIDTTNMRINCVENIDYINASQDNLNNICFHLYDNAFKENSKEKVVSEINKRRAQVNGESYGSIDVLSVKIGNREVNYALGGVDNNILIVPLLDNLKTNNYVKIYIESLISIPNLNHRFGYGNNTINLGNFYPIACKYENGAFREDEYTSNGDPFYSDMANYNVNVQYNSKYILAHTGNIKTETINNNIKSSKIEARAVRDFAMILSDKYKVIESNINNTKISYLYFNDKEPDKSLNTCCDALKTFNSMIGIYPYSSLMVAESDFVYGGMEYPNLVFISTTLENKDYINTIIHEIGHQWFYGIVGNDEIKEAWLDEGLTEYITSLFYQKNISYEIAYEDIVSSTLRSYMLFVDVYKEVYGKVDSSMNRELKDYPTENEYVYLTYVKGLLLFDNLRTIMGDKAFFNGLKNYYNQNKFKIASEDSLIKAFEEYSSKDIGAIVKSWIEGKVVISN